MVQLAFMAPLVGLIAQGAVLRTNHFPGGPGLRRVGISRLRFYLARKDEIEGLLARIQALRYYFVPAACMLTIFWFGTATSVTWSSVVLLFVGLIATHMALFYPPSAHRQITVTQKST